MEQRRFSRITFIKSCQLLDKTENFDAAVQDISLRGALLELRQPRKFANDALIVVDLALDAEHSLHLNGIVRYQRESTVGIEFNGIDIDSITVLKRMMELNLGSELLIEREIEALIEFHQA